MTNDNDIKLRQMILGEYNAGTTQAQALRNLEGKFEPGFVTRAKIRKWYEDFDKGRDTLRNSNRGQNFEAGDANPAVQKSMKMTLVEGEKEDQSVLESVSDGLKNIYKQKLYPLEEYYRFHEFHSPALDDPDFTAASMILVLGQSEHKKNFISNYLQAPAKLNNDQFIAVMYDKDEGSIPGNALMVDSNKQFRALTKFGNAFLNRFQCSTMKNEVLKSLTIIDTPGILSGEKQRIERDYDYIGVLEWFAERVDRIILLFDAHKLDISDEFKRCIEALSGNEDKIRIVLNKSDCVSHQQLTQTKEQMFWTLGKVFKSPEVSRVYIGSFWDHQLNYVNARRLFQDEQHDLFADLQSLPRNAALRKLNDLIKRARLAKVHAYIIDKLDELMFEAELHEKEKKKKELIQNLDKIFDQLQKDHSISPGDFPDIDKMREHLKNADFTRFNSIKPHLLEVVDEMLATDITCLMAQIPKEEQNAVREAGDLILDEQELAKLKNECRAKHLYICVKKEEKLCVDSIVDAGETYDLSMRWSNRKHEFNWTDDKFAMIPILKVSPESMPSQHFTLHSFVLACEFALFSLLNQKKLREGATPGRGMNGKLDDDFVIKAAKLPAIVDFVKESLNTALKNPKFVVGSRHVEERTYRCKYCDRPFAKENEGEHNKHQRECQEDKVLKQGFFSKESEVRRRVLKIYNLLENDFSSLREYNDYLEHVESIIAQLVNDENVAEVEEEMRMIEIHSKANERNRRQINSDDLWINELLEEKKEDKEATHFETGISVTMEDFNSKPNSIISELRDSNIPAEVILDRKRKIQTDDSSEATQAKKSKTVEKSKVKEVVKPEPAQQKPDQPKQQKAPKKTEKVDTSKKGGEKVDANEPVNIGRLDLRVGRINKVEIHPTASGFYMSQIDVGEKKPRTVISGLVKHVPIEEMQNRLVVCVCNLKPAKVYGIETKARILCASTPQKVEIMNVDPSSKPGDCVITNAFPSRPDAVLKPKEKVWETVAIDLKVSDDGKAVYKGEELLIEGKNPLTASTLRQCLIKMY